MGGKSVTVGVLALQGNVSEHIDAFAAAFRQRGSGEASVIEVRSPADLSGCAALAIPGGESTTISRLIDRNGLYEPIRTFPGGIFATCAGMVLMATLVADPRVHTLGLMDMTVDRNAFGRQKESFEADITVAGLDGGPFHAIFIRAPVVTSAGTACGCSRPSIRVSSQQRRAGYMALAFHPELGGDLRLHERFLRNLGI